MITLSRETKLYMNVAQLYVTVAPIPYAALLMMAELQILLNRVFCLSFGHNAAVVRPITCVNGIQENSLKVHMNVLMLIFECSDLL